MAVINFLIMLMLSIWACSSDNQATAPGTEEPPADTTGTEGEIPRLETMEISNITWSSAEGGGQVTEDGSSNVTERGLCRNTDQNPTIEDVCNEAGSVTGSGKFTVSLNDLEENTTYYTRAYAVNDAGVGYGDERSFTTQEEPEPPEPVVLIDSTSFQDTTSFNEHWDLFYPWGDSHNGSALMVQEQMSLQPGGVFQIIADPISHADYNYDSGAIHNRDHIVVNDSLPKWEISGDFQVPTDQGTWPAFWITGVWNWPPEVDIMEFKGDNTNWQNTATGPDWSDVSWQNELREIPNADNWHNYKIIMKKRGDIYVDIEFYIDGEHTATHVADDFVGEPFWLIINLQMEGDSGSPGPDQAEYRARNVYLAVTPAE